MKPARSGYVFVGRVLDGTLDAPIARGAVATEGEQVAWVGTLEALPARFRADTFETVDLPGRTIMPGLIDGHTHISFGEARSEEELALYTPVEFRTLKAMWNAKKVLQAGVTSAFDAATTYNIAQSVRDAVDSGMFDGPRFAVSGRQLTSHQGLEDSFPNEMAFPPGQAGVLVRSRDEIIEQIRYQVKDNVDAIKVSGSNDSLITPDSLDGAAFSFDEFKLIADEAHRLGRMCTVHARSRDAVLLAAKAGFDVLFHASYIDDEGIEWAMRNNAVIVPTLPLLMNILEALADAPASPIVDAFRREVDAAREGLAKAYRAGVPLVPGSESGWSPIPYGEWHARELQIFVEDLGMSPLEAMHAGTLARNATVQAVRRSDRQARGRTICGPPGRGRGSDARHHAPSEADKIRLHRQGRRADRPHAASASEADALRAPQDLPERHFPLRPGCRARRAGPLISKGEG